MTFNTLQFILRNYIILMLNCFEFKQQLRMFMPQSRVLKLNLKTPSNENHNANHKLKCTCGIFLMENKSKEK